MMQEADDHMDLEMQLLSSVPDDDHAGGGGGGGTKIHAAILVVHSVHKFLEGISGDQQDQKASFEDEEEVAFEYVDVDQGVPLLNTIDKCLHSRKQIQTLTQVLRSMLAFKAHAGVHVHHDNSGVTEGGPENAEASDSSAALSQHHITIDQPEEYTQIENIAKIVQQKDLRTLEMFGGLDGVKDALDTDLEKGISEEEARNRQHELFLRLTPTRPFVHLLWKEVKNKTIILLFMVIALSIVLRIDEEGLQDGWLDGVLVFVVIVLQVFVASIHKYRKQQRARKKLHKQQLEEMSVKELHVLRGGVNKDISEFELVYGDLLLLKKGCQVPADGLFVYGEDLELEYGSESYTINKQMPFLSYGERVKKGDARMVVTSTNMMMSKARLYPNNRFKLEADLDKLNTCMHYIRIVIGLLIIVVLFLRYIAGQVDDDNVYRPESIAAPSGIRSFSNTFNKIINESKYTTKSLMKLLSLSLIGLTEGVPFVVSIAIIYLKKETLIDKVIEQDPHGVLKMASVTKICTDTFGEFTENDTEVQHLFVGGEFISEDKTLSSNVFDVLCAGIGTSKENAYLKDGKYKLGLNSERMKPKQQIEESEEMILHLNGPVDEIMSKCTHYYNIQGEQVAINDGVKGDFRKANGDMMCTHGTIAVACKHKNTQTQDAEKWVLIALLGLKNKNNEETKAEVKACKESGIDIIIVSGKKLQVVKDMALQYGLITNDDPQSFITGPDFRKCTDKERQENVDKIHVVGDAFSSDKLVFVETLMKKGEVVVFLGQKTEEACTLMRADIGISMGRWSSKKAIESSDIIILDGSFSEIISMVHFGKCIYQNIQSFLQPVLITTISTTLINLIQTTVWGDSSLTILQSVYVNLAVLFLGGLALLTNVSSDPITCGRSLITANIARNILVQVSYQVTCLVIIQTKGSGVVGSSQYMKTVLSNIFIMCQFFNLFNARELQKMNFFRCIHLHKTFWVAIIAFVALHAAFVSIQDITGYGTRLNWKLWAGCVLVGVGSWLVDWLAKCISWFIKEFVIS